MGCPYDRAVLTPARRSSGTPAGSIGSAGADSAKLISDGLAFDPAELDDAVQVGQPPRWADVLWGGYDVEAVNRKLDGLGVDKSEEPGAAGPGWTG